MSTFIGRENELKKLHEFTQKRTASFILVKGRRRIGKSRLIEEFSKEFKNFHVFSGLAPDQRTTNAHQLEEFSRQFARQFHTPFAHYVDWSDALSAVGERVRKGKTLLLFDEISWMGSKDPTFLGKIKNLWDLQLRKNDKLIFIVCGSASAWIEKNILNSTGFVGRISYTLTLNELCLSQCGKFWSSNISAYEKMKVLSITGGVPKYLEEINPQISAEENIKRLAFTKGGFLVNEFDQIFSDIFLRNSSLYKAILSVLAGGSKDQAEINASLGVKRAGRLHEYLEELELSGFVTRDYTWDIKSARDSKLSHYRLSDNYMRFYLKYIEKNLAKINRNNFSFKSLNSLPGWDSIAGLQFENLVVNNRLELHSLLGLNAEDIVCENPYFQRSGRKIKGCQIDYLIQTRFGSLYVCEIKYSKKPVGSSVVEEVQKKIEALHCPKGISFRPVLIHVNGITPDLEELEYFAHIVDFGRLLE